MKSWREIIKIHPAAELLPLMEPDELKALALDIREHGLKQPIVFWQRNVDPENIIPDDRNPLGMDHKDVFLIDGRNRLDAIESLYGESMLDRNERGLYLWEGEGSSAFDNDGYEYCGTSPFYVFEADIDPYDYVISANIHRRHLTTAQKGEIVAALLKANPERSDRATAAIAKVSDKTIAAKRRELERGAEIPHHDTRVGKDGVAQPADKRPTSAQRRALKAREVDIAQGLPDPLAEPEKPAGGVRPVRIEVTHYEIPINIPSYLKSGPPPATQAAANATSTGELPIGDTLNFFRGSGAPVEPRDDRPWNPRSKKFAVLEGRIRGMLSNDFQDELQRFVNDDVDKIADEFPESLADALWDLAEKASHIAANVRAKKVDIREGIAHAPPKPRP